jgi:hypothetical protein
MQIVLDIQGNIDFWFRQVILYCWDKENWLHEPEPCHHVYDEPVWSHIRSIVESAIAVRSNPTFFCSIDSVRIDVLYHQPPILRPTVFIYQIQR